MDIKKSVLCFCLIMILFTGTSYAQKIDDLPGFNLKNLPGSYSELNNAPLKIAEKNAIPSTSNALLIGLSIPSGRLSTQLRPGFSVGYDYNFNFAPNVDFYFNVTGNLFTTKKSDSASAIEKFVDLAVVLEYYVGPRFFIPTGKGSPVRLSGEAGIGFYTPIGTQYIFDKNDNFSGIESLSDALRGGVNIGFSAYITGARTIIAKVKYHQLFSIPTSYFGLYAGLVL